MTIKELQLQVDMLTAENTALKAKMRRMETAITAVEGVVHQIDNHDATPEDLREAKVKFRIDSALRNIEPIVEPVIAEVIR